MKGYLKMRLRYYICQYDRWHIRGIKCECETKAVFWSEMPLMYKQLEKLIDDGTVTFAQARYIQQVSNNNPMYEVEFTVCEHGGVIMEVWKGNLRQRGVIFGLRRDGTFVEDSLCPDWRG